MFKNFQNLIKKKSDQASEQSQEQPSEEQQLQEESKGEANSPFQQADAEERSPYEDYDAGSEERKQGFSSMFSSGQKRSNRLSLVETTQKLQNSATKAQSQLMKLISKSSGDSDRQQQQNRMGSENSASQEEFKESKISSLMGGGRTNSLVQGLQGVRIGDNPAEREVFLQCPNCKLDVFDSGLSNDLICKKCAFEFSSGKKQELKKKPNQITIEQQSPQKITGKKLSERRESDDAGGSMPKTPDNQQELSAFDQQLEEAEVGEGNVARTLFQVEQDNQVELRQRKYGDQEEEKKEVVLPSEAVDEYGSSETDSDDQNRRIRRKKKPTQRQRRRADSSDEYEDCSDSSDDSQNFDFTADNLMERPGQFFSSLLNSIDKKSQQLIHGNQPNQTQSNADEETDQIETNQLKINQRASQIDSSSKYVNELENVLLFVVAETVMDDFKDDKGEPDFQLLLQGLLMPFFQMRARILEKSTYFEIGEIQFFVAATSPHDFGKITSNSIVRLLSSVNRAAPIERINLVPLRRIETPKSILLANVLQPFFSQNIGTCLHKNQTLEIGDHEFFIKYCRPQFGSINNGTEVKIDSSMPKSIRVARIAPIWNTQEEFNQANQNRRETTSLINQQVLKPYFFCGLMCYLEKGETLKIAGKEFFVNDCQPRQGIIDASSHLEVEIGFTQETFLKKQVLADQRFAERLQSSENHVTRQSSGTDRPHRQLNEQGEATFDLIRFLREHRHSHGGHRRHGSSRDEEGRSSGRRGRRSQALDNEEMQRLAAELGVRSGGQLTTNQMSFFDIIHHIQQQQAQNDGNGMQIVDFGQFSKTTPKAIVDSLPLRAITAEQIKQNLDNEDEGCRKCMICMIEYEEGEELRTMPCMHFFHKECIDKWLLERGSTCPICKFNIKKDYNVTSAEQLREAGGEDATTMEEFIARHY